MIVHVIIHKPDFSAVESINTKKNEFLADYMDIYPLYTVVRIGQTMFL